MKRLLLYVPLVLVTWYPVMKIVVNTIGAESEDRRLGAVIAGSFFGFIAVGIQAAVMDKILPQKGK